MKLQLRRQSDNSEIKQYLSEEEFGYTCMHQCVISKNPKLLSSIIERSCSRANSNNDETAIVDLEVLDFAGNSALHLAASFGELECMQVLKNHFLITS